MFLWERNWLEEIGLEFTFFYATACMKPNRGLSLYLSGDRKGLGRKNPPNLLAPRFESQYRPDHELPLDSSCLSSFHQGQIRFNEI